MRDVRSIWNLVRKSLKRLNSEIVLEGSEILLKVGDISIEPAQRKEAFKILSEEIPKGKKPRKSLQSCKQEPCQQSLDL